MMMVVEWFWLEMNDYDSKLHKFCKNQCGGLWCGLILVLFFFVVKIFELKKSYISMMIGQITFTNVEEKKTITTDWLIFVLPEKNVYYLRIFMVFFSFSFSLVEPFCYLSSRFLSFFSYLSRFDFRMFYVSYMKKNEQIFFLAYILLLCRLISIIFSLNQVIIPSVYHKILSRKKWAKLSMKKKRILRFFAERETKFFFLSMLKL